MTNKTKNSLKFVPSSFLISNHWMMFEGHKYVEKY